MPPAVRKQAERAEAALRASIGQADPASDPAVTQQVTPDPAAPPAAADPAPTPAQAPPAAAPAPAADEQLRATQGRLDAERERNANLQGQVTSLNNMIGDLQRQMRELQQAPKPAEVPASVGKLVTQQEIDDYGPELMAVVGKRARDEVAGEITAMQAQINSMAQQLQGVGKVVGNVVTKDVFEHMDKNLPTWRQQNTDPDFNAWLQLPEPFSGEQRRALLMKAFDGHDAERVLMFFKSYLTEVAATGAAPQPAPSPAPASAASSKVPLENFAAPGKASPAAAATPAGSPGSQIIKQSQITQFYTEVAAGKYRGRDAERIENEKAIWRAQAEGTVVAG